MTDAVETPLPRPRKTPSLVEESTGRLVVQCAPSVWQRLFGGGFLMLWLVGWTVGCVFLVGMVIEKPEVRSFLFATPFLTAWVTVAAIVYAMLFERETATFDDDGLSWEKGVPGCRRRRFVPLAELLEFCLHLNSVQSDGEPRRSIEAETIGRPLRFGTALGEDERLWLIGRLNERLAEVRRRKQLPRKLPSTSSRIVFCPSRPTDFQADPPIVSTADVCVELPSDSFLVRTDDFDAIEFSQRGRFEIGTFFVTLFINLFWNGIVSVFLSVLIVGDANGRLEGASWWGLFLFLTPFEAVGLVMFVGLIAVVLEPWHRTRYVLSEREWITASHWLGVGRSRTIPIRRLDRLEVRQVPYRAPHLFAAIGNASSKTIAGEPSYHVAAVDAENREAAVFAGLTLGEACYLAAVILRERKEWFR